MVSTAAGRGTGRLRVRVATELGSHNKSEIRNQSRRTGVAHQSHGLAVPWQAASCRRLDTGAITRAGYEGQRLIDNLIYEGLTF
ncbi:hypothetical protein BCD48_18415 [Pseudofrankia sp. BMG5.36]|nr:hypothetical protein BCD48_18415 [Pseudofrankia sp. BMG5.36]